VTAPRQALLRAAASWGVAGLLEQPPAQPAIVTVACSGQVVTGTGATWAAALAAMLAEAQAAEAPRKGRGWL
jgi:hypothetical protein